MKFTWPTPPRTSPRRPKIIITPSPTHREVVQLVYIVAFVDLLSASMTSTLLSTYLKNHLNLSSSMAGIIGSIYGFVQCFSSPIVGGLADLHGYRTALLWTIAVCVPAYALLSTPLVPFIIFARALAGSCKQTQNLSRTFVAAFATDQEKVQAFGTLNAVGNIGFILGPALSGWITANCGFQCVFLATGLCFAINFIIVYRYFPSMDYIQSPDFMNNNNNNEDHIISPRPPSPISTQKNLLQVVKSVDWVSQWDMVAVRFLVSLSALVYRSGFNWYVTEVFNISPQMIGYLTSYQGTVAFLASYYCSTIVGLFGNDCIKALVFSTILGGAALLGFMLSPSIWVYSLMLCPYVISNSLLRVVTLELTTERSHRSDAGLLLGVYASTVSIGRTISPAVGGISHDVHPSMPTGIALILYIISLVLTLKFTTKNQILFSRKKVD